jgi:hypothetical protein
MTEDTRKTASAAWPCYIEIPADWHQRGGTIEALPEEGLRADPTV